MTCDELPEAQYLTDDAVLAALEDAGAPVTGFPVRWAPQDGVHPGDKVFRLGVPLPGERAMLVAFRFGQPDPDPLLDWKPRWISVDGPMTRAEAEAAGRE